ncbi:MAG: hypothetical protein IJL26_05305, partial [Clostridia bacterium]|nr:hypothetical protein [Clostridia bacterium]
MMKKKLIKAVCLVLLFALSVGGTDAVLRYRYIDSILPMKRFYEQEKNSVDVLGLGTSHIYEGLSPGVLYREYGIAAYNLCAPAQAVWSSWHYFVEALKTQSPKAAVFDVYMLNTNVPYDTAANAIKSTYGMKWSKNRLEALAAAFGNEDLPSALIPFLQFHSRYAEMTESDDGIRARNSAYYGKSFKGYTVCDDIQPISLPDVTKFTDTRKLAEKHEQYFRNIIETAISNKITLFVVSMPYALAKDTQTTVNSARKIAESYKSKYVKFLDLAAAKEKIGLDPKTDFANNQHLNRAGSVKVTKYLGAALKKTVKLTDRRKDPAYETWAQNAELFYRGLDNFRLKHTTDTAEYKERLEKLTDGYTVMLADNFGKNAKATDFVYFTECFG